MLQAKETLRELGFVYLPAHLAGPSINELVKVLGLRVRVSGRIHELRPAISDINSPNTYSGRYGLGEFPFHTDLAHHQNPPPFLVLRCLRGYAGVFTPLVDGHPIVEKIGDSLLSRALVQARRPIQRALPLLAIWEPHIGKGQLRWDHEYLRPASAAGEEAMQRIVDEIAQSIRHSVTLCETGDTLIIDNRRMLHARSQVPPECQDRTIERAYLEYTA